MSKTKKKMRKRKSSIVRIPKVTKRNVAYLISIIFTIAFFYINTPFLYQQDILEPFAFYSDSKSVNLGLKYNNCSLESIDDSTSDYVDFYFGCNSEQMVWEGNLSEYILMYYGNCPNVTEFNEVLLDNDIPDYLIEFPFDIENIGRSYRKRIYIENGNIQKTEDVNLKIFNASHFCGETNTLIVEWADPPSIKEFRFNSRNVFKQISFEKKAVNFYITDQWMRDPAPKLERNVPLSIEISLKIPHNYHIENIENYDVSYAQEEGYIRVKTDLVQKKFFHIILTDPVKSNIKIFVDGIWLIFVAAIIVDTVKRKIFPKSE